MLVKRFVVPLAVVTAATASPTVTGLATASPSTTKTATPAPAKGAEDYADTDDLAGRGWLDKTKYLSSVQAGTEVFTGSGQLDTSAYSVKIS
ncbi:hypothetical protein BJY16_002702 [Actinoplanes octamycinicus]|uniref:Uncharacterized protein n=1 Tax=Actinoplanes octamycinicus TaxID=135948 RepID=A0A7W7GVS7_9ACTN|nr:hypothetical protein [Actinoplanes octamycinicus]MBB4739243.1 hypothetical protein [Actinoplanes octamycinicus]GIE58781.1 hypothetical protein Aoc01nite_41830 [Actinoplanes octamycinicus]